MGKPNLSVSPRRDSPSKKKKKILRGGTSENEKKGDRTSPPPLCLLNHWRSGERGEPTGREGGRYRAEKRKAYVRIMKKKLRGDQGNCTIRKKRSETTEGVSHR